MPDFYLRSVIDNKTYSAADFSASKALLVAFICNHCPYVRAIEDRLIALKRAFSTTNFDCVLICSNDAKKYPDDSPEKLAERAREKCYDSIYLIDQDQTVAKAFGAVCTPDLFLYDASRRLFYHGELDDNWQDENKVTKTSMKNAIQRILDNKEPPEEQKPSMGCSIKWLSSST
jgi:hypothetical protein